MSFKDKKIENITVPSGTKKPMSVFYGSNTGTCEALAQTLANAASGHGYSARVAPLDSATDALPHGEPVVIITASYEGEPADNAAHFMQWLRNLKGSELDGVQYAVFGCGHRKFALSPIGAHRTSSLLLPSLRLCQRYEDYPSAQLYSWREV